MSGGDHIHSGTVVGKLEGEREVTLLWGFTPRRAYTRYLSHPRLGIYAGCTPRSFGGYPRMAQGSDCSREHHLSPKPWQPVAIRLKSISSYS